MEKTDNTILLSQLPQEIIAEIIKEHPEYNEKTMIHYDDVLDYRLRIIEKQLQKQSKLINESDKKILKSIQDKKFISSKDYFDKTKLSFGQKVADGLAKFGGSWSFVIIFIVLLLAWIILNVTSLFMAKPFDPYPFILLNLVLSCLAALQAPIIMISQNREEERDREQAIHDYEVNLKSEIEVRLLHEKLDHLIYKQMKQLNEMQQLQLEYLKEIREMSKKESNT